jgi:hypothetical protein
MRFRLGLLTLLAMALTAIGAAPAMAAATAPPGYARFTSMPLTAPAGDLDAGTQVACPDGKVVWGGGIGFFGGIPSVGQNINTTAPLGNAWRGRFNNLTAGLPAQFTVHAICANRPQGYTMAFTSSVQGAMAQLGLTAVCPVNTVVLSGGVLSSVDRTNSYMLSAFPVSARKFRAVTWNGTANVETMATYAICAAKPPKYRIASNSVTDGGGPDSIVLGGQSCPAGTAVIGGGVKVTGANPGVSIGLSLDASKTNWAVDTINSTPFAVTSTFYAICAA